MKQKRRKAISLALVMLTILMFTTIAFAKEPDSNSKTPGKNYTPITYKGTDKATLNTLGTQAITQASLNTGRTYGNPGLYDLYSGSSSSSSSSSTSTTKKTSTSSSSSGSGGAGTTTTIPATPAKTPRPSGGGDWTPPVTPDLAVTNITPASYRGNSAVMSTVTVQGLQNAAVNGVEVRFDAGGATQSKTLNVPANSKATVLFTWTAPSSGPVTLTATVNPSQTVVETDYTNNSYSRSVSIQPPFVDAVEQPEPVPIPARPGGENNDYVEWDETENGITTSYWARLTLTATPFVSQMKSGYGFGVTVSANVTTNYHTSFTPSQVVMFIPERGYHEVVRLVNSGGIWTLPVSPYSAIGAQKWYVPVWFPDATTYSANITAVGASTPGGELTATIPVNILIDGNMYQDDSTNNTWAR